MPWSVKKNGDKFCVYKKGGTSPISGGCHPDRSAAVKHMRALYANEGKSFSEKCVYVPTKGFSELETVDERKKWIQVFPFGRWTHPVYDDTTVNRSTAEAYVKNFHDNVRRQKISTDYEHGEDKAKGSKASGEYLDMEVRDDGVYALVEFTETAFSEINAGEWKYFSPLFYDVWEDAETEEVFENVVIGGALTNNPWMKDMVPINFSEAVLEEEALKYKWKGDKWIASENDGESWRNATVDEVAELEHSEPGTGNPPQPRPEEDDRSGDKDGEGIRRDTPPPQDSKEGSNMGLSAEALKLLGLDEEADEKAVELAITTAFAQLPELKEFHEKNQHAKKFAEEFPEEAKRMEDLQKKEDERSARAFSEKFSRIVTIKGEGDDATREPTTKGFSSVVLNEVANLAKAFSEGSATLENFDKVMELVSTDKAIVDYGEIGSQRVNEEDNDGTADSVAKSFAEKATKIMNEANSEKANAMSWGDAVAEAARQFPDLAKAYSERKLPKA